MDRFFWWFLTLFAFLVPAEERRVWYDGSSGNYWSDTFDVARRVELLHYGQFSYDAAGRLLDFRFKLRSGAEAPEVALVYERPGMPPAESIVVTLRNLSTEPVRIFLAAWSGIEGGPGYHVWKGWDSEEHPDLPADGAWHDYSFPYAPEGHGGAGQYPLRSLVMYLNDIKAEQEIHLQIRKIELVDDWPPKGKCENALTLPQPIEPLVPFSVGPLRVEFRHRLPVDERVWLEFSPSAGNSSPEAPCRIYLSGVERIGMRLLIPEQTLALPPALQSGEFDVTLHCGEAEVPRGGRVEGLEVRSKAPAGFPKCEVVDWKGAPAIRCDGEILPGVLRATYTVGPRGFRAFADAGVRLFAFTATPNFHAYHSQYLAEAAPGEYDFSMLDESMQTLLAEAPDARVILRVFLGAPFWWCAEHPDDCVWVEEPDGSRHQLLFVGGRPVPSWTSQAWRSYCREGLDRLLEHLRKSVFAEHVIGILLASGNTEEWLMWGENENLWADYSPAARTHFRNWLKGRYASEEELRVAWQEPEVTFENAEPPTRMQRAAVFPQSPDLRDLAVGAEVKCVDFYRWNAESVAETIAFFAHEVKVRTDNRLMVGPFYGYLFELAFGQRLLNSGHAAIGKLLDNPEIDFFASPLSYAYREVGGAGVPMNMGPAASLALHKKLWIVEMDVRTSQSDGPTGHCGKPATLEEDLLQQDKVAVHTLCAGMAQWWFDVGYVNYSNPLLMKHIGELAKVFQQATRDCDRTSEAQIAYVVDEGSLPLFRVGARLAFEGVTRNVQMLEHLGATVEYYLACDLDRLPERIRLIVLGTSVAPSEAQKAALERLKSKGRVIVFLHAPGFYPWRKGQTSAEAMQEFTGLPLWFVNNPVASRAVVDFPDGRWMSMQSKGTVFEADRPVLPSYCPCPYIEPDARTLVLAHLDNSGGALAVREEPDWTAIYSALSTLPREMMLSAMRKAGVHRYLTSEDQVWATKGLLGVCVNEGGEKTIRLKKAGRVRDALTGEVFDTDAEGVFTVVFAPRATRLFILE